ncbi:MAG TPA: ABC transporter permease [Acidimicrobiales bacterium]|nr:ABC transporter permease [Acidimicrobiales bacterium]
MATLSELTDARELFQNLTLRELRGKYKRSVLGWLWSLINPLATMAIFAIVFRFVLRIDPPRGDPSALKSYPFFLLSGLLAWNFLSAGMTGGMGSLLANGNLIKKVYFPREILTASVTASWAVQFCIELSVLAVALAFVGNVVVLWIPGVLLVLALQAVFVYGIGLALGALVVYFRDVQHLVGIALQLWFYATPVIYPVEYVPRVAQLSGYEIPFLRLYQLNPMVHFVEAYRDLLYDLRFPPAGSLAYMAGAALVSVAAGRAIFNRFEHRLAEEL